MDREAFDGFVRAAARRAVQDDGKISRLVLTQASENLEPKIREPEMRHALAQVAESRPDIFYGIEAPTREGYRFTSAPGEKMVSARHDLVILSEASLNANRMNLVELKEGQPALEGTGENMDCPMVSKDILKLILERAEHGKSMIHICHAANSGTIPALLRKYNVAVKKALRKSLQMADPLGLPCPFQDSAWFTLFVLVLRQRGQEGHNRPYLYRQHIASYGQALGQVQQGQVLFDPQSIESELLAPQEGEAE